MNNSSCGKDLKERYEKLYGASKEMRETRTTLKQSKKLLLNQTIMKVTVKVAKMKPEMKRTTKIKERTLLKEDLNELRQDVE